MKKEYIPSISFEIEPCEMHGLINWDPEEIQLRVICLRYETGFTVFGQLRADKRIINATSIHLVGPENEFSLQEGIKTLLRSGIFDFDQLLAEYKLQRN